MAGYYGSAGLLDGKFRGMTPGVDVGNSQRALLLVTSYPTDGTGLIVEALSPASAPGVTLRLYLIYLEPKSGSAGRLAPAPHPSGTSESGDSSQRCGVYAVH
jgi:hypothetical protein